MANFNLDGHKLQYHSRTVADFLEGKSVNPIYVEISPQAVCNHRCIFCHYNYLGHKGSFPKRRLEKLTRELARMKIRSLVFAGTGEPLLHPETVPAIQLAKRLGIDAALSTNGALLKDDDFEVLAKSLTWIRFSFNGGNAENYALMHGTKKEDYFKVLENIKELKAKREMLRSPLTIGVQFILLPQNKEFLLDIAQIMKDIGVDYFVVKHFYGHPKNPFAPEPGWPGDDLIRSLQDKAKVMSDKNFTFAIRDKRNLDRKRSYNKCLGLPFIVYIREDGEAYTCFSYQHDKNTSLGNIFHQPFSRVWLKRQKAINYINENIQKDMCQANCRHHQINTYLWELKHPTLEHINFI